MRRALLIAIAFFAAAAPGLASQTAGGAAMRAGVESWSISGTVVSATTGAPLDRAEVTLGTTGTNGTDLAATVTGDDGAFRFDGLAAGKYALQASRRGYITGSYEDHGGYFTAIVTGPGLDSQGLRFELMPYGVIDGTVMDDNGGPIAGARVSLFRQDDFTGEGKIIGSGEETTDDSGSYEFTDLRPDTYYLDVSATPWYAFRARTGSGNQQGDDGQTQSPLDVAYPLTFYPNASDSGSATPITINAGDHVQANFSLHAVPAIHIQLRVPINGEARRGMETPMVAEDAFGSEQATGVAMPMLRRGDNSMTFDFGALAPGHYLIQQGAQSPTTLDAASSRTLDTPGLSGGVDISGQFAMASGTPLPDRLWVWLRPIPDRRQPGGGRIGRDGMFTLHSVAPGTYEVMADGGQTGALVVAQMAASGAEVRGSRITVGSDPVLLAATLAKGSTTISGFAKCDGKGVGGTMIVLVPHDPDASTELFRRDQSDSDGSFTLRDVVPGSYTLVAIENGWTLEWAKREVMAPYLIHGLKVEVGDNQKTMNLPEPVAVQER